MVTCRGATHSQSQDITLWHSIACCVFQKNRKENAHALSWSAFKMSFTHWIAFPLRPFQWFSGGTHLKPFLSFFKVGPDSVWNFIWWFLFVSLFIAIGFTGQVKKIWQEHIFFIFDGGKKNGSEVWFWKLQVGRVGVLGREGAGLVQCSNQGQIEFTCLRFRGSSANCRHTNTVGKHTHALSDLTSLTSVLHTDTHTHTLPHLSTSTYPRTCKTKGRLFHTNINVQTEVGHHCWKAN